MYRITVEVVCIGNLRAESFAVPAYMLQMFAGMQVHGRGRLRMGVSVCLHYLAVFCGALVLFVIFLIKYGVGHKIEGHAFYRGFGFIGEHVGEKAFG